MLKNEAPLVTAWNFSGFEAIFLLLNMLEPSRKPQLIGCDKSAKTDKEN